MDKLQTMFNFLYFGLNDISIDVFSSVITRVCIYHFLHKALITGEQLIK